MIERKPLIWFLAIAFLISWPLFLLPLAFRNAGAIVQQTVATTAWALAMWAPGIAAIVATVFVAKQGFRALNLNRFGRFRFYLVAWFLPPALVVATIFLTVLFRAGTFDLNFTFMRQSLEAAGGQATPPEAVVAAQIIAALLIGPLFNIVFALGEELGWRGFLLPKLLPLGPWKAMLISGAIWGLWHAPAILQGHNYPDHPVLGVFLMVVFCALLGVIFSWLYLETKSVWAPALAHGSLNAWGNLPLAFLLPGFDMALGGTLTSLIGWVPLIFVISLLFLIKRLQVKSALSAIIKSMSPTLHRQGQSFLRQLRQGSHLAAARRRCRLSPFPFLAQSSFCAICWPEPGRRTLLP